MLKSKSQRLSTFFPHVPPSDFAHALRSARFLGDWPTLVLCPYVVNIEDLWWPTSRTRCGQRRGPVVANVEDPGWPISRTGGGRLRGPVVTDVKDPWRPMSRTRSGQHRGSWWPTRTHGVEDRCGQYRVLWWPVLSTSWASRMPDVDGKGRRCRVLYVF
jgi:hypothetical protein